MPAKAPCDDDGKCPQAHEASDQSVEKVFAIMGVDVNDPEQVELFRRDLRFSGDLRRSVDSGFSTIGKTALAIMVGGFVMGAWAIIQAKLGISK